ncbi:MAG: hypothetical protein HYY25_02395 [Candidatus Wallbacteria bacterium]|nr:hypothetical protein [Candidatus Wallbacteria bacterium]
MSSSARGDPTFRRRHRPPPARGFSLVEALLASAIAFVAAGIWVGMHAFQARQDRDLHARLAALDEARGAMERVVARPFRFLAASPVTAASVTPSPAGAFRELAGAAVHVSVRPYADAASGPDAEALEIDVVASWREDGVARKLRLTTVRTDSTLEALP